jgi:hypothetical protein
MAAADTPDGLHTGALGGCPRGVSTWAQLVEAAQCEGRYRPPDADRPVELTARDALEQILRDRPVGGRRLRDGSGGDQCFQRQRSLSSTDI